MYLEVKFSTRTSQEQYSSCKSAEQHDAYFPTLRPTVNSWAKNFMRNKFSEWYASQIREGLDSGKEIEDIEVKTPLIVMKPMYAQWIIELYNEFTSSSGREVVVNRLEGVWYPWCLSAFKLNAHHAQQDKRT